jgi:hypothetical protein
LVEVAAGGTHHESKREGLLTRRDFVMFFAGVGTTLLAILVGSWVAALIK